MKQSFSIPQPVDYLSKPFQFNNKERIRHSKETAKALRKQIIMWLYSAAKSNPIKFSKIQDKCQDTRINRMFSSVIIKSKILVEHNNGFIWNPDIINPDFESLTLHAQNNERAFKRLSAEKNVKSNKVSSSKNTNDTKLDYIIEKLNAISKAIGIQ